jgi:hypothetical protein
MAHTTSEQAEHATRTKPGVEVRIFRMMNALHTIPTGLRPSARGCAPCATPGNRSQFPTNPNGVASFWCRARCQVSGNAEAQGRRREPPAVSWMNQKLGRVLRQLREKLLALKAKIRAEWKSVIIIGPTLSLCLRYSTRNWRDMSQLYHPG